MWLQPQSTLGPAVSTAATSESLQVRNTAPGVFTDAPKVELISDFVVVCFCVQCKLWAKRVCIVVLKTLSDVHTSFYDHEKIQR